MDLLYLSWKIAVSKPLQLDVTYGYDFFHASRWSV